MSYDMTRGDITSGLMKFALPLMIGNLLQQVYNIADTLIVGRYLGEYALAAVGSSYTLMIFLTSVLLGLCMGSGAFYSIQFGAGEQDRLKKGIFLSFVGIGGLTVLLTAGSFLGIQGILWFMRVPDGLQGCMKEYLICIFWGIPAVFIYNFIASLLRSVGDSLTPLIFLGISALLNVGLDLMFILVFRWGVAGAASATVLAQYAAAVGILIYYVKNCPLLRVERAHMRWDGGILKEISSLSVLTCLQQSVMNFGILMVQGLVNSFGTVVMAAFAAAVKIDSFAYSPVQDFGNAFSTYVAQNYGAGKRERIWQGMKKAVFLVFLFCVFISLVINLFAGRLMSLFIDKEKTEILSVGIGYLRIEASCYFGIGLLFLFYGFYRGIKLPQMSLILTVLSLGSRVLLAYMLSAVPQIGVTGIWLAVPIGWGLADLAGGGYYLYRKKRYKEI